MTGKILANTYKISHGANPETALGAGFLPTSGSFVALGGAERVHVIVHMGAIATNDAPTVELMQAEAVNGTPKVIDTTALKHTFADTDDGKTVTFTVEGANLDINNGYGFVTIQVGGTVAGSYGDVTFLVEPLQKPAVQGSNIPTANQHSLAG